MALIASEVVGQPFNAAPSPPLQPVSDTLRQRLNEFIRDFKRKNVPGHYQMIDGSGCANRLAHGLPKRMPAKQSSMLERD